MTKRDASSTDFIACTADAKLLGRLRSLHPDRINRLRGTVDCHLLHFDDVDDAPKAVWLRLQSAAGDAFPVLPVLTDDEGHRLYPTGEVVVRFDHALKGNEVKRFCKRHGLSMVKSNKFQPKEVSFRPARQDVYLPDLVSELAGAPGVVGCWADTRAEFIRA